MESVKKKLRGYQRGTVLDKENIEKDLLKKKIVDIQGGDEVWVEYRDSVESERFKIIVGKCISVSKSGADLVIVLEKEVGGIKLRYGFHKLSRNIRDVKVAQAIKRGGRAKRL